jgi:hypothetical protein
MDDRNFDEIIKGKFEAYEDPDFDSSALADFHERLSSVQYTPWYVTYRTECLVAGLLVLFTLANALIVFRGNAEKNLNAATLKIELKTRIDSLTSAIHQLKANQKSIFILDPAAKQTVPNEANGISSRNQVNELGGNGTFAHTASRLYLGGISSLPPGVLEKLTEENVLEIEDGRAYLILSDKIKRIRHVSFVHDQPDQPQPFREKELVLTDEKLKQLKVASPKTSNFNQLSGKMINKIEAHQYVKGIGLNVSPHLDLLQATFSRGTGGISPRVGITTEWVVAPHWSIETSLDYLNTNLAVHKDFEALHLVDLAPELGALQSVEINTRTLSLPINIKYRWWLTRQHQLVLRGGYTPYFSLSRQYLYRHPYPGRPADSDKTLSTLEHSDDLRFYGGTINFRAGVSTMLKKKSQFEIDLFYEQSLGTVGSEKLNMQLYGVRTAFTFRVK